MNTGTSLFRMLIATFGSRLAPLMVTKRTLVTISHLLEHVVIDHQLGGVVCAAFETVELWRAEEPRYRELSITADLTCVLSASDLPPEDSPARIHVPLPTSEEAFAQWFVVVLSDRFSALMCTDVGVQIGEHADVQVRPLLWSFERDVVLAARDMIRTMVVRLRPDRSAETHAAFDRYAPGVPNDHVLTLFATQLIAVMGAQEDRRIQLERKFATESQLRSLGQVLSGVAHELNNPLQSVLGFGSLLLADPRLVPDLHQDVHYIVDAGERARGIVQNLLQMARVKDELTTAVALGELVEKTLVFVRTDLDAATIVLTTDIEPNLPPVLGNLLRLQQLLINLLMNAIQALADHAGPRAIRVQIERGSASTARLLVQDTGPGMAPALQQHIFEPFFTTKPTGQGTGLGLSIVRTIVEEHRGTISVDSAVGGGSSFRITLPVTTHVVAPDLSDAASVNGPGAAHVLLVDDDLQGLALVRRILERAGYVVLAESSAEGALHTLAETHVDIIVSDLTMPGMDGMQFYAALEQHHPQLTACILFITGDATRGTIRQFLETTGRPVVLKPFAPADLLARIRQFQDASQA